MQKSPDISGLGLYSFFTNVEFSYSFFFYKMLSPFPP